MSASYTRIPLETLDSARLRLRAGLKDLEKTTGKRYGVRTFYLGPRRKNYASDQGTTNKSDAYAAKLAVYEMTPNTYPRRDGDRVRNWNFGALLNYV